MREIAEAYASDSPLPANEYGVPISEAGAPHTELGKRKGRYAQAREFDEKGDPVKDIDFTDHGYPREHPNPHQHPYNPNSTGGTPQRGNPESIPWWNCS